MRRPRLRQPPAAAAAWPPGAVPAASLPMPSQPGPLLSAGSYSPYGDSIPGTLISREERDAARRRADEARAYRRAMAAMPAVAAAWNDPGPRPELHRQAQAQLRRDWPALAQALDHLTTTIGPTGAPRP